MPMFNPNALFSARAKGGEGQDIPVSIAPDSPLWQNDSPMAEKLAEEYLDRQAASDRRMFDALDRLVWTMQDLVPTDNQAPPQVVGTLLQPDGSAAGHVQVGLELTGASTAQAMLGTTVTLDDGSFVLPIPAGARATAFAADLVVTSAVGVQRIAAALKHLQPSGMLPVVTLPEPAPPLSMATIAALQKVVMDAAGLEAPDEDHVAPALAVGEDECQVVFRRDASSDRFPYGVFFRLTDPSLSQPSLRMRILDGRRKGMPVTFYGGYSAAARLAGGLERLEFHLAERVPVDRPISIDAFRDGLATETPYGSVPLAGSLSIGYVVTLAQRWTPLGLALGDLVYSLPLAPGEQQRMAIMERTASTSVIESERLESSEAMSFAEQDDTSATATFSSAFREAASGGSQYDTHADSFSIAAAAGGGAVFPFGCAAGGVATSFGESNTSGSTSTWMSGARDSTSGAAQSTHSAVQRQAAARRSASRTSMRLATATESTEITTKVITNHNKTRALTMQYWEVQRLFDVTTACEGVTLTCQVPLDVVRFLPAYQPPKLTDAPATRDDVLARYDRLLGHADILGRVVPARYRRGLSLITDFASDPTTAVADAGAPATDVLDITLIGTFLDFDDLFVTVVGKRGMRVGPYPLSGNAVADTLPTGKDALATEDDLFGRLRAARSNHVLGRTRVATVSLPPSFARQDITGFEITRRTRRLDYHFAPPAIADLGFAQVTLGGLGSALEGALKDAAAKQSKTGSYDSDRLEREIGGPQVTSFVAAISGTTPQVVLVDSRFGGPMALPAMTYPIAARTVPPVLSYASVLEIEKTLQWVMRNTMTCSVAVFASLTPEERAVMLERYEITLPPADDGTERPAVPLLSCITNNVLGYFGNSMVLPFMIPAAITDATAEYGDPDEHGVRPVKKAGLTTGQIQDALTRFHTDGFSAPRSTIALPTKGVLGEAVLGHCPSAERVDLTRFWNWQDSPGDEATQISPVGMPQNALAAGLTGPSALTSLNPMIQNFSMAPVAADTTLASALIKSAEAQKSFDIGALTNAAGLTTLTGKTLDTAESARKDALGAAKELAIKAMETSASIYGADKKKDAGDKGATGGKDKGSGSGGGSDGPGGSGDGDGESGGSGTGGGDEPAPEPAPAKPTQRSIYFPKAQRVLKPDQKAGLDAILTEVKAGGATGAVVRGYASPEGTAGFDNVALARDRATNTAAYLTAHGVPATTAEGGVLPGGTGDYPKLRRADMTFQY
ncbi:OmpA family protein [Microbacterium sp. NPDC057659]|uniref:OmpA family protein n=1 Tax=Microbacterium sp. NPDC057659 TaxID=3346198 RepID=UPI00366D7485